MLCLVPMRIRSHNCSKPFASFYTIFVFFLVWLYYNACFIWSPKKFFAGEWRNITWLNKIDPIRFHAKRAFQWYMVCLYCADPCVVSITWVIQSILMCFWVFLCSYGCCKNAVWYRRWEIQYYICMCHNVVNYLSVQWHAKTALVYYFSGCLLNFWKKNVLISLFPHSIKMLKMSQLDLFRVAGWCSSYGSCFVIRRSRVHIPMTTRAT